MSTSYSSETMSRADARQAILDRLEPVHHEYAARDGWYGNSNELDFPVEDWFSLPETVFVTINVMKVLFLNSHNLWIADVDYCVDDPCDLSPPIEIERLRAGLGHVIGAFDDEIGDMSYDWACNEEIVEWWKSQSFRLYRTYAGYRILCTSNPVAFGDPAAAERSEALLKYLQSDPRYIAVCNEWRSFRARLTPKPWRIQDETPHHVCEFVESFGPEVIHPDLAEQLKLHDEMTLPAESGSRLA